VTTWISIFERELDALKKLLKRGINLKFLAKMAAKSEYLQFSVI
jgi:hypothetical protein